MGNSIKQDGHCHPWQKVNLAQADATRVAWTEKYGPLFTGVFGYSSLLPPGAGDPGRPEADHAAPSPVCRPARRSFFLLFQEALEACRSTTSREASHTEPKAGCWPFKMSSQSGHARPKR